MRALVTGATGFVGRHLVAGLQAGGWDVRVLVRPHSDPARLPSVAPAERLVFDDTMDGMLRVMEAARPDVVFNLASLNMSDHMPDRIEPMVRANVLFVAFLLEAMALTGSRHLVNMGSAWQHYEGRAFSPVCLYASTKQSAEMFIQYYTETGALRAANLRLFHAYGPGEERPRLLRLLCRAAASGETLAMSEGRQLVDLVYVDDVVHALIRAARHLVDATVEGAGPFAISSGRFLSVREVVAAFGAATGASLDVRWGERPYKPREIMAPIRMGDPLPDWAPAVPLEEGIRRTYQDHLVSTRRG